MAYQVGQTAVFSLATVPTNGTNIYSYVWEWWDGTKEATTVPFNSKRINIGGHPLTGSLLYACKPVQTDGQSTVIHGSISANNAPIVISPLEVTLNNGFLPYQTEIRVTAYDIERDDIFFSLYEGSTFIANGTTLSIQDVIGTWALDGTVYMGTFSGTQSTFPVTVRNDRTVTVYVRDESSGTTALNVGLYGQSAPRISAGGASYAATATSIQSETAVHVGPGATVDFSVYGRDPAGGAVSFEWLFSADKGWTSGPSTQPGSTVSTVDGGYQNTVTRDVSSETMTVARRVATAVARVSTLSESIDLPFDVTLIRNSAPTGLVVTAKADGAAYGISDPEPISPGTKVEFAATAADAEIDVVEFVWTVTQPSSVIPNTLELRGPKIVIDTTGYTTADTLSASVYGYDRFGLQTDILTTTAIPFE